MLRLIGGFSAVMAVRRNTRSIAKKAAIAVLAAASLAGCAGFNTGREFNDTDRAFLLAYVRFDENTGSARLFLRDLTVKEDARGKDSDYAYAYGAGYSASGYSYAYVDPVMNIVPSTEEAACVLYAGTVAKGKYEIHELAGAHMSYTFPNKAQGNVRVTVSKADVSLIGQFQMSVAGEAQRSDKGFSFKPTTGCPGETTAIHTLMKDDRFRKEMDGTAWYDKLVKKYGKPG